jgi:light-regulated signal transduction histidine kinase (bacteriophytochrome)
MDELIENLLSFSRMARAELHAVEISLTEIVDRVKKNLEEQNGEKKVDWHIGKLPRVSADPNLMGVVITNLLSNALKYSRERNPPRVEIGTQEGENEHIIFVRDNGVGFDMEYAHKLFGVFQRLHDQQEFEGTGIGLANVKRVILRHGGRVWAEGAENQGATFYFALPKVIL